MMRWRFFQGPLSVRSRLILGNALILGLILLGLGVLLRSIAGLWMARELDREMAALATPLSNRVSHGLLLKLREQLSLEPQILRPGLRFPLRALDRERRRLLSGEPGAPYDEPGFNGALKGNTLYTTTFLEGEPARVLSLPLRYQGRTLGVLQLARPLADLQRELDRLTRLLLLLFPVGLLAAVGGSFFMTTQALRPVRAITRTAAGLEARNLSERLTVVGDDEFAELAFTFNAMLARLESAFARQRRFAADASHELRTPLAAITGDVSLALSMEREASEYRQALEATAGSAERMRRIVQDLLLVTRSEDGGLPVVLELVSLAPVLRQAAEMAQKGAPGGAEIEFQLPEDSGPLVVGDSHYLERLFVNLLENALRHTPASGKVGIYVRQKREKIVVLVEDNGEGIAPEHQPYLFESFYRADAARVRYRSGSGGTGLGLAICKSIVEAHQGEISLASVPGEGTIVTVTLPLARLTD